MAPTATNEMFDLTNTYLQSLEGYCYDLVVTMPGITTRLYRETVRDKQSYEDYKKGLSFMVNHLRRAMKDLILTDASQWMDENTTISALDKLEMLNTNLLFPDWVIDDEGFEKYLKEMVS